MTFCMAWVSNGSAFLVADTLQTQPFAPTSARSSFDELHSTTAGKSVEEWLLKISNLGQGAACAYAGDARRASDIIDFMQENLLLFNDIEELLSAVDQNFSSVSEPYVELLVIQADPGGAADAIKWDSYSTTIRRGSILQIGSLGEFHSTLAEDAVAVCRSATAGPEEVLTSVLGVVQSFGVHDSVTSQHVGGAICGVFSTRGQLCWQPDTAFFLPDNIVITFFREESLMLNSSALDFYKILVNRNIRHHGSFSAELLSRYGHEFTSGMPNMLRECKHWIFLSNRHRLINLLLLSRGLESATCPISVTFENEQLVLSASEEFHAHLHDSIDEYSAPGATVLKVHYC